MGVGRFFCVALPFILTVGSLIFLLIACLAGVTNKGLYAFRVDTTEFQMSTSDLMDIVTDYVGDKINLPDGVEIPDNIDIPDNVEIPDNIDLPEGVEIPDNVDIPDIEGITSRSQLKAALMRRQDGGSGNITAKALGLDRVFDVSIWGYCERDSDGDRNCTDPELDWANKHLNTSFIEDIEELSQGAIELPEEVSSALDTFQDAVKWTQVAYIIAFVGLALSVLTGIFANCTRVMSCVTYLFAQIASVAVVAAAALSTATAVVVVGAVESTAEVYGVRADFNNTFLAMVWISAILALGASFFWLFTICCCAPSKTSRRDRKRGSIDGDGEKLVPGGYGNGAYQPLGSPQPQGFYGQQQQHHAQPYEGAPAYGSGGRNDMAYEPYSHRV